MSRIVMILLSDGLRFPSGAVAEAPYRHLIYCKVPEDWIEGDVPETADLWIKGPSLRSERLDSLLAALYGDTWHSGNSDGSQYVVLGLGMRLLNPAREAERPWEQDDFSNQTLRYLHYVVDAEGHFQRILPSGL